MPLLAVAGGPWRWGVLRRCSCSWPLLSRSEQPASSESPLARSHLLSAAGTGRRASASAAPLDQPHPPTHPPMPCFWCSKYREEGFYVSHPPQNNLTHPPTHCQSPSGFWCSKYREEGFYVSHTPAENNPDEKFYSMGDSGFKDAVLDLTAEDAGGCWDDKVMRVGGGGGAGDLLYPEFKDAILVSCSRGCVSVGV